MKYFVAGGAGFIGSHTAKRFLAAGTHRVTVYDNFSSGKLWHLEPFTTSSNLVVIKADIKDLEGLACALEGQDLVYHFASNPDISRAVTDPAVDFWQGTFLTHQVLEGMRLAGVQNLVYASGSGVYGDSGILSVNEAFSPMRPISTYGASKLAGEALACAYSHMFGLRVRAFRFANVVGPNQTHGVAFDFIRRLSQDPSQLNILGDGSQSKSYIDVEDVISAIEWVLNLSDPLGFDVYNVATPETLTVSEIAALVIEEMGLDQARVELEYSGGDRGWKGDVPIVRIDAGKIRSTGWQPRLSAKEALRQSVKAMLREPRILKSQDE